MKKSILVAIILIVALAATTAIVLIVNNSGKNKSSEDSVSATDAVSADDIINELIKDKDFTTDENGYVELPEDEITGTEAAAKNETSDDQSIESGTDTDETATDYREPEFNPDVNIGETETTDDSIESDITSSDTDIVTEGTSIPVNEAGELPEDEI